MFLLLLCSIFQTTTFSWLVGTWHGRNTEVWKLETDGTLSGVSYMLNGKEKMVEETMRITLRDGECFYVPIVVGQNNNEPVEFKIVEMGANYFAAENLLHDFPQRIGYKLENKNNLVAFIEGISPKTGQMKKIEFKFTRE